jgi:hypothetical protein
LLALVCSDETFAPGDGGRILKAAFANPSAEMKPPPEPELQHNTGAWLVMPWPGIRQQRRPDPGRGSDGKLGQQKSAGRRTSFVHPITT